MPKSRKTVTISRSRKGKKTTVTSHKPPKHPRKDVFSALLGGAETVAGILPGAIRGIRSITGKSHSSAVAAAAAHEASFATPASFACVSNNITQVMPEGACRHPTLGIAGKRVRYSQPWLQISTSGSAFWRYPSGTTSIDAYTVPITPLNLFGPINVESQLHDRYRFNWIRLIFTTFVTTNTTGIGAMCIEKDISNLVAIDFNTARMVTPNVTFPYRIPKAALEFSYDGPELFYTGATTQFADPYGASGRQICQAVLKGYDSQNGSAPGFYGLVDIECEVEWYDPVPPTALMGRSVEEREALRAVRAKYSAPVAKPHLVLDPRYSATLAEIDRDIAALPVASSDTSCMLGPTTEGPILGAKQPPVDVAPAEGPRTWLSDNFPNMEDRNRFTDMVKHMLDASENPSSGLTTYEAFQRALWGPLRG